MNILLVAWLTFLMNNKNIFLFWLWAYLSKTKQDEKAFDKVKNMNKSVGLILIVVGIIMLVWTGFTYTRKEKIVDAGPIQISADREKSVNWPPYVGGIILAAGVFVLVASKKKWRRVCETTFQKYRSDNLLSLVLFVTNSFL